jgi:dipeptidyl aminopeptidase/acylaminoacyl peptidase
MGHPDLGGYTATIFSRGVGLALASRKEGRAMARRMLYLPLMVAAAVLLACLAAVATLLAVSKEAESTFPGKNGRIAFVSTRDTKTESGDIYTMNPSGTAVERLTNHPERDFEPAWSPDGGKIAFASYRHSNEDIYTINADGTGLERLTHDPKEDDAPAWSPDGNRIAFVRDLHGKKPCRSLFSCNEIYIMNANGQALERLTNNRAADFEPDWQPLSLPDNWPFKVKGSA